MHESIPACQVASARPKYHLKAIYNNSLQKYFTVSSATLGKL